MGLLFATAGIPRSAKKPDTISGLEHIKELGLDGMELEFVQGVRMNELLANEIRKKKESLGLTLTVHAPYFINLNAREKEKITASQIRIYESARIGALCGAINVTFHVGFYLGDTPEKTYQAIKKNLNTIIRRLEKDKIKIRLTPELTGKPTQFGSLEELIRLVKELPAFVKTSAGTPRLGFCLDFSHFHARSGGKNNSYTEFADALKKIKKGLGNEFLKRMHIHISGIKYSIKGEREHLNLQDSDFNYKDLLKALKDYKVEGILICESPNLEEDAMLMKSYYKSIK
ncbi:MAG: TIM barrel protein [Planctomycetota bacterium]